MLKNKLKVPRFQSQQMTCEELLASKPLKTSTGELFTASTE